MIRLAPPRFTLTIIERSLSRLWTTEQWAGEGFLKIVTSCSPVWWDFPSTLPLGHWYRLAYKRTDSTFCCPAPWFTNFFLLIVVPPPMAPTQLTWDLLEPTQKTPLGVLAAHFGNHCSGATWVSLGKRQFPRPFSPPHPQSKRCQKDKAIRRDWRNSHRIELRLGGWGRNAGIWSPTG